MYQNGSAQRSKMEARSGTKIGSGELKIEYVNCKPCQKLFKCEPREKILTQNLQGPQLTQTNA